MISSYHQQEKIGIITGYGLLPEIFVNKVNNFDIYLVGFKRFVSRNIIHKVKKYKILTIWSLSEIIDFFQQNDVTKLLFLGYVPLNILLKNPQLDQKASKLFSQINSKTAMQIFHSLLNELSQAGFTVEPIDKYLNDCFAEKGSINSLTLTEGEIKDVEFGYNIAKSIASLDVGLTVVVKNGIVVAVEALEGTDRCILRAGKLAGSGCCVVKVARPQQDMRFDLPVIGPTTVKVLARSKANILAVESNKTLILKKDEVIKKSYKLGIKLYGI
ncbi:MAG: UDP-2,3-diacylglucosamine diphosphatase LpxI [Endomicrobia bacterium]|nr:UDP-2,3-diacylglucosamine diphosphatase LpxI [Endomicrobiia bacterium]